MHGLSCENTSYTSCREIAVGHVHRGELAARGTTAGTNTYVKPGTVCDLRWLRNAAVRQIRRPCMVAVTVRPTTLRQLLFS